MNNSNSSEKKPFEVGDVVAVLRGGIWKVVPEKDTIAKKYKNGNVVLTRGGQYRQTGDRAGSYASHHTWIAHWAYDHDLEIMKATALGRARKALDKVTARIRDMDTRELVKLAQSLESFKGEH